MNTSNKNLIGTILSSLFAVGLVFGAATLASNSIDQAAKQNQKTTITASPTPATTLVVSPIAVPTHKSAVIGTRKPQITADPDPIVNCEWPHVGTLPEKKSECGGTKVECEISSGKWQVAWKTDCDALLKTQSKAQASLPNIQSVSVTPAPASTVKVQFTTTEATVNGTYYCFADRVNELTRAESNLKLLDLAADVCHTVAKNEAPQCFSECNKDNPYGSNYSFEVASQCSSKCYYQEVTDKCKEKDTTSGTERKKYNALINQICP